MNTKFPRRIATAGGILIILSGLLNLVLGALIGAVYYEPYPGGMMGHVGVIAGMIAVGIGLVILLALPYLYDHPSHSYRIPGAILTFVLGHAGAVFGALYVGTGGVILCYIAGIWLLINFLKDKST